MAALVKASLASLRLADTERSTAARKGREQKKNRGCKLRLSEPQIKDLATPTGSDS